MARRKLIWHIGLAQAPRPVVGANLQAHRESLESAGVSVAASDRRGPAGHPRAAPQPPRGRPLPRRGGGSVGPDLRPGLGAQGRVPALHAGPLRRRQGPDPARPRPADRPRGAPGGHPRLVLPAALRRLARRAARRPDDRMGQVRRPGARRAARAPSGRPVLGRPRARLDPGPLGLDLPRRPAARGRAGGRRLALDRAPGRRRGRGRPASRDPAVRRPGGRRRAAQGEPPARGTPGRWARSTC